MLTVSCDRESKAKKIYMQEKEELSKKQTLPGGDELLVQYMPDWAAGNTDNEDGKDKLIKFRAELTSKNQSAFFNTLGNGFYQTDSLFCIVNGGDTMWPLYVFPVANGIKSKREYIVTFPLSQLATGKEPDELLFVAAGLRQYYNGLQPFSFKLSKINKLENLN
jgi:hypothetical protein